MKHYIEAWKNSLDLGGRATRKAFWFFFTINLIILIASFVIGRKIGFYEIFNVSLVTVYFLVSFVPHTTILIRRLRDANCLSYVWLILFPIIGYLVLLLYCFRKTAAIYLLDKPFSEETKNLLVNPSIGDSGKDIAARLHANRVGITLESNLFFTERNFEIFNMDLNESIFDCEEIEGDSLDGFLRFTSLNRNSAAHLKVLDKSSKHVFSIVKSRGRIFSKMFIADGNGNEIGILEAEGSDTKALDMDGNVLFKVTSQSFLTVSHYKGISKSKDILFTIEKKDGENIKGKSAFTNSIFLTINDQIPSDSPLRIWFLSSLIFFYILNER